MSHEEHYWEAHTDPIGFIICGRVINLTVDIHGYTRNMTIKYDTINGRPVLWTDTEFKYLTFDMPEKRWNYRPKQLTKVAVFCNLAVDEDISDLRLAPYDVISYKEYLEDRVEAAEETEQLKRENQMDIDVWRTSV